MAVEFVLVGPAFILLMLLMALGGRVIEAQGQVDGAARDAARAASVQTDVGQVQGAVQNAAAGDLSSSGHSMCPDGMTPSWSGGTATGGVTVTVQCSINVAFFPGLGALTLTGHAVAPLDSFVSRNW
jgi:Flp pilus assembly protein TadG